MKTYVLFSILFALSTFASGQSCVGKWVSIDDITKEKKSIIELYKIDGKLYGKILYLYPKVGRADNPTCDLCEDDRKGKHFIGLQIIRDLTWNGSEWHSGKVLEPKSGVIYSCKIWLNSESPNYLNIRGYSGPFYRTQTWVRIND